MEDRQIIELYHARDEKAIEETDKKYGKYCLAVAFNILQDRQHSEECVNDSYLSAWNSIPPAKPASLRIFLSRIVRNRSLNRYKEERREKRGGGQVEAVLEEIDEFVADTVDIADDIAKKELVQTINRFLYSLPDRDSNLFVKRYFHYCSTKEIAEMYGLTENNVLKILCLTRKNLKQYLIKEGYSI